MHKFDTKRIAANGILLVLSLMVLFHVLVMFQVIPYGMVWGGRLKDSSQMLLFEAISIAVNLLMLGAVVISAGIIKVKINRVIIQAALWTMFAVFLLNTIGNLLSNNETEKLVFTPLTLLLSLFSLRLAISKDQKAAISKEQKAALSKEQEAVV
jgi:hypothetical protein